jgi:hypothetical protein
VKKNISLHGDWRFKLDEADVGVAEKWHLQTLPDTIKLPGILQSQGYGNEITLDTPFVHGLHDKQWFLRDEYKEYVKDGNVKVPFIARPTRHYIGAAWYQTDIIIPDEWEDRRVELCMERPKWKTSVWVDNVCFGDYDSLCAEHSYDLGILQTGSHVLTVRVDNSMIYPYRPDSHSISDSSGNSWNGIVGKIELISTRHTWIDDVRVYPDYKTKSVLVKAYIKNINGELTINEYTEKLGDDAELWSEFNPALQTLEVPLYIDGELYDTKLVRFGLRNIETKGNKFLLNGKTIYFRGTNDHGCFPLTGYPPTDIDEWRRIYSIIKAWGMNHIRYHSYCPPKAAFEAADELGLYLHIEPGGWNYYQPGNENEKHLYMETDRIIKAYGNHPGFMTFCSGNEPHGNWQPVLKGWAAKYRETESRFLFSTQCGRTLPIDPEPIDFADFHTTVCRGKLRARRQHGWFGKDYEFVFEGLTGPFLAHELGQHCAYPDFAIIEKFSGYLKPSHYEIFKDSLAKNGMLHKNKEFMLASGMLQALCYKEEIEANLRTKSFSGFSLLDLHDYTGQCGAFVGLLDPFWGQKPYVTPEWFRRFNAPIVPLIRLEKNVFTTDEKLSIPFEIASYAPHDFIAKDIYWEIIDEHGKTRIHGMFDERNIETGGNTAIGTIRADLSKLKAPAAYKLIVGVACHNIENEWSIWVYPSFAGAVALDHPNLIITNDYHEAVNLLKQSKSVLFLPPPEALGWNCPPISYAPIFWNAQMGPNWGRPLGLLNETTHPALSGFPTSIGLEWQWKEIVKNARAINVSGLPAGLRPIVQPIDDWNRNYKLALLFECTLYGGKLMVCSADLQADLDTRIAARQLRHSVINYMNSEAFSPAVDVTEEQLKSFLFDTTIMNRLGVKVTLSGHDDPAIEGIISGDPNRYWLSDPQHIYPFTIEFEVNEPVEINGLCVMPRQNHRSRQGAVKSYEIYTSSNGKTRELQAQGDFAASFNVQNIYFEKPVVIKKLHLKLIDGFGADIHASLAQVAFITDRTSINIAKINYTTAQTASEEMY